MAFDLRTQIIFIIYPWANINVAGENKIMKIFPERLIREAISFKSAQKIIIEKLL